MNDFKCKCCKCNKEDSFTDLKAAYMDGWTFGKNAVCWDCQKSGKVKDDLDTNTSSE